MGQLERIYQMEQAMERVKLALLRRDFAAAEEDVQTLEGYIRSGQWLEDYEADERGEIPVGLKRGVLSQDGLFDLLDEWNIVKREGEGL